MEESDIKVPLYYVLGREATDATLCLAHSAFITTPCYSGVVGRNSDKTLIQPFVAEVLQATEDACRELAAHVARTSSLPVLTVGEGNELTAVYPGGEEECLFKRTLTSLETSD